MKSCYVTGATGCIGRNLVEQLLLDSWNVVVLHRKSSDLSRLNGCAVTFREVDLHDALATDRCISEPLDAIFHVAANVSHWSKQREVQWKDNVLATRNLVHAALNRDVKRFIFTSTGATLSYQGADETLSQKIKCNYTKTKRLAELELSKGMQQGLDAVILHPIIVLGRYDYNNYAAIFSQARAGRLKFAFPGRIAFCHAVDVARAHIQAFEKGRSQESYVLGGTYTSWLDTFQRIARLVGATTPKQAAPAWLLYAAARVIALGSNFTGRAPGLTPELVELLQDAPDVSFSERRKTKEQLGYESKSLDVMLQDCYEWLCLEVWKTPSPEAKSLSSVK